MYQVPLTNGPNIRLLYVKKPPNNTKNYASMNHEAIKSVQAYEIKYKTPVSRLVAGPVVIHFISIKHCLK